jgi:potassium-transporting ATPase KdpC subunit
MSTAIFRPALSLLVVMTAVLGFGYPLLITAFAQAFPEKAGGSLILQNGKPMGSRLIGQSFTEPKYFWGRPSATGPMPYNAAASSGSNQGPLNPALKEATESRAQALREADPTNSNPIPVELVTASASGLDPEISPAGAAYQMARVAKARGLSVAQIEEAVAAHRKGRFFGVFGEPRVNVLELNLALDALPRS